MDGLGHQLLAGSRLAGDQDRAGRRGDPLDAGEDLHHLRHIRAGQHLQSVVTCPTQGGRELTAGRYGEPGSKQQIDNTAIVDTIERCSRDAFSAKQPRSAGALKLLPATGEVARIAGIQRRHLRPGCRDKTPGGTKLRCCRRGRRQGGRKPCLGLDQGSAGKRQLSERQRGRDTGPCRAVSGVENAANERRSMDMGDASEQRQRQDRQFGMGGGPWCWRRQPQPKQMPTTRHSSGSTINPFGDLVQSGERKTSMCSVLAGTADDVHRSTATLVRNVQGPAYRPRKLNGRIERRE